MVGEPVERPRFGPWKVTVPGAELMLKEVIWAQVKVENEV